MMESCPRDYETLDKVPRDRGNGNVLDGSGAVNAIYPEFPTNVA